MRQDDGSYAFKTALDWPGLCRRYALGPDAQLSAGHLLSYIANMREDLYLAAQFGAGMAQDRLGAKLTKAKCSDLAKTLDI